MNKSSSDLEKASQGSAESLSPSFRSAHGSFTPGSTDSLASDSRTCSDGGNRLDLDREAELPLSVSGQAWVNCQDLEGLSYPCFPHEVDSTEESSTFIPR